MFAENTYRHPEWKRLADEIRPLLETTRAFSYELLKVLGGIDIRTNRGRQQFERFRQHALSEWGIWFECDRKQGYHVADVSETPAASMARMRRAKRQNKKALAIVVKTNEDGADITVIAARRQLAASLGALLLATENESKKIRPNMRKLNAAKSDPAEQLRMFSK